MELRIHNFTRRSPVRVPCHLDAAHTYLYFCYDEFKYYPTFLVKYEYMFVTLPCGPGSSVGIATDYGLDGPGLNPGGDEIFRPSTPALGPTQPPVQWLPGLSQG